MDVRGVLTTEQMKRRRKVGTVVALLVLAGMLALVAYNGTWADGREILLGWAAMLAAWGLWALESARLRRLVRRRAADLERHARALGLTPSASDSRVSVGIGAHGRVRLWVEDPPMLRWKSGTVGSILGLWIWWVSFAPGMLGIGVWFSAPPVLIAAMLLSAWMNRRPTFMVECVSETGQSRRARTHHLTDIEATLSAMPTVLSEHQLGLVDPGLSVPDLLALVRESDENVLMELLTALGERGTADSVGPLERALRQRGRMSPRLAGIAEGAVAQIRRRHALADEGAIELADDHAGRFAIAPESGALGGVDEDE